MSTRIARIIPSEDKNSEKEEQQKLFLSFGTDAINHVLAAANCPQEFRPLIDYLVGISGGNPEFEAADGDLASRVRLSEKETTPNADRQWLKRIRKEFEAWQERNGFLFVECRRGYCESALDPAGNRRKVFHKTRYYLHLLDRAAAVITEAQKAGQFWEANPLYAIERAARQEVKRLSSGPRPARVIAPPSEAPWYVWTRRNIQSAHTFLRMALESIPPEGELLGKNSALVDEIERQLEKLKRKKG